MTIDPRREGINSWPGLMEKRCCYPVLFLDDTPIYRYDFI
jgi:hypothetical protein